MKLNALIRILAVLSCLLIALSCSGNELSRLLDQGVEDRIWTKNLSSLGDAQVQSINALGDGGFVLSTDVFDTILRHRVVVIVKLDSNGVVNWKKTYEHTHSSEAVKTVESQDSSLYILANCSQGQYQYRTRIIKINPQGEVIWDKLLNKDEHIYASDLISLIGGDILITGERKYGEASEIEAFAVKLDAKGDTMWTVVRGQAGSIGFRSVTETHDGSFVLVGQQQSPDKAYPDSYILKLDSLGDVIWERSFGNPYWDRLEHVRELRTGQLLMIGVAAEDRKDTPHFVAYRMDAEGNMLGQHTIAESGGASHHFCSSLPSGAFVVAGALIDEGRTRSYDFHLIKVDSSMTITFDRIFGGPELDYLSGVTISRDEMAYVVTGGIGVRKPSHERIIFVFKARL
jgi:uncharacterized protein (UPF0248 family)